MKAKMSVPAIGLLALVGIASGDDWPAWRGPAGNGVSAEKNAPVEWAPDKNVKWKAALPQPCNGSPIVSNGRVFVTCSEDAEGKKRSLYCFDRKDGRKLWAQTVEYGKRAPTHGTNRYCPTTPAADGERVVVWEGSAGLHAYDFEGRKLWSRDLGEFEHMWGDGSSPVLYGGKVILHTGPGKKRIFVAAFDAKTGKTLWETEEPFQGDGEHLDKGKKQYEGSWCTPLIVKVGGKDQIVCAQPSRVVAYDPGDGKILWWCEGLKHGGGVVAYSSPILAGDILVYTGGYGGPGFGVRLGGKGDVTATHRIWWNKGNPQCIGSGVHLDGHVYQPWAGQGMIECMNPGTGKQVWRERAGGKDFWGSAVLAAGRLYVTDQGGTTVVFKPSPQKLEILAVNKLGEESNSTPAISNGEIFLRTFKHLYCIAE